MSQSNVKVFKSSIVPAGETIEPLRSSKAIDSLTIELFHIACFLVIFSFLFAGLWRRAVKMEKREKTSNLSEVKA